MIKPNLLLAYIELIKILIYFSLLIKLQLIYQLTISQLF